MRPHKRIILALDVDDEHQACRLHYELGEYIGLVKVGLELFTKKPTVLDELRGPGPAVMLDLKLHDIPNTVKRTVQGLAQDQSIRFTTAHASGGSEMISAAVENARSRHHIAVVTVLTSLGFHECTQVYKDSPANVAMKFARMAAKVGARTFVCSPREVAELKQWLTEGGFSDCTFITPGIRLDPSGSSDDQARVATPRNAIRWGADYLVIGRPILQASDKVAMCKAIAEEIQMGLEEREES